MAESPLHEVPPYPRPRSAWGTKRAIVPITLAALLVAALASGPTGCVFRFANAERNIDDLYRSIYLPAAGDQGSRGGVSSRVSQAVRRALALDTRFRVVPANEARVAVDVQVLDSRRVTTKVIECKTNVDVVASGSRRCPELVGDFSAPDASAEEENTVIDLRVRIVDLNDGRLLFNRVLENVTSGPYDLVGNDDTRRGLQRTPELHSLRYVENVDRAYARVGEAVAGQVVAALLSLDSYDTRGAEARATSTPAADGRSGAGALGVDASRSPAPEGAANPVR